jgi:predicted alpha-1,2-mannosidase
MTDGNQTVGGVFTFSERNISSTVGISFISSAKACSFADDELPISTELQTVVNATKASWNSQVLSKITTTETNQESLQLLYSSLYGMHLLPSNRTGENPNWESSEPYFDDLFTLWDLFRCTTALTHILQPVAYEEQIRSMIDVWRHDGYLPDGRSSNYNGKIQGGTNADNVLADAYVKGVRGAVNWTEGYQAMLKDAEVQPVNNHDPMAPDSSTKEGRGALPDWKKHGYITPSYTRAVSRAIEYSGNDFGLYQVSTGLNLPKDAAKYLSRSRNWRNHWNSDAKSLGFEGFVMQRKANGDFIENENPLSCGGCYWHDPYYQGLPWEYSFGAHHDMATLIRFSNGSDTFTKRLNTIFQNSTNPHGDPQFHKIIFGAGNEPSFTSPYLFNFAGQQHKSVEVSRQFAKNYYNPGDAGLPGNSDAGAMQSWLLWNIIGLYPITGQTTFLIGSPWFSNLNISLGGGKQLVVNSVGGGNNSYYVQSLKINGNSWNKSWLTWNDIFRSGGTLDFELGPDPINWDTGELPPSPASGDSGKPPRVRYQSHHRHERFLIPIIVLGVVLCLLPLGLSLFLIMRCRRDNKMLEEEIKSSQDGKDSTNGSLESKAAEKQDGEESSCP